MLLPEWTLANVNEVMNIIHPEAFPNLRLLSLSGNMLNDDSGVLQGGHLGIKILLLDDNKLQSMGSLANVLALLPNLSQLSLQGNKIESIGLADKRPGTILSSSLQSLNISRNRISSWSFVDDISRTFPKLVSLRISNNPLYSIKSPTTSRDMNALSDTKSLEESSYMLTLARIGGLQTLNYSNITAQDRLNGELYYLSDLERGYSGRRPTNKEISLRHPRYHELCKIYDKEPLDLVTAASDANDPKVPDTVNQFPSGSLAARLVRFEFRIQKVTSDQEHEYEHDQLFLPLFPGPVNLPRSMSTYSLKGWLQGESPNLVPLKFKLIYESGEVDPVVETILSGNLGAEGGHQSDSEWDIDPDQAPTGALNLGTRSPSDSTAHPKSKESSHDGKKWKKREVEMLDSTRELGSWLDNDATHAIVRIELA